MVVTMLRPDLPALFAALRDDGHRLVGPTIRDGSIVYAAIERVEDLPIGWTDRQGPGRFRLERRGDEAVFGYVVGQQSFKHELFAPTVQLWRARRRDGSFTVLRDGPQPPSLALIGARACDLHAIAIQDQILRDGPYADGDYAARRHGLFVVAVNCGKAGGTCFCASMETGPRATRGFDLALTELLDGEHRFVTEVAGDRGAAVMARVPHRPASDEERAQADAVCAATAATMGRRLDTRDIRGVLRRTLDAARWDEVATRCLACTNCTLVCPTCFCSTVEDATNLAGDETARVRRWDSCFNLGHSWLHGGSVRTSIKARYRQWLTHKLGTWIDQFGVSGCVGCGRCITWCPVGIDITEEAAALRRADEEAAS